MELALSIRGEKELRAPDGHLQASTLLRAILEGRVWRGRGGLWEGGVTEGGWAQTPKAKDSLLASRNIVTFSWEVAPLLQRDSQLAAPGSRMPSGLC